MASFQKAEEFSHDVLGDLEQGAPIDLEGKTSTNRMKCVFGAGIVLALYIMFGVGGLVLLYI